MRHSNEGWFQQQFGFLRRQFLQQDDLPFSNVLDDACIETALETLDFAWKDRIYTPLVTLWVLLGQVLSADHSCRGAVARLIAHLVAHLLALQKQVPTVRLESVCRRSFSRPSPRQQARNSKNKSNLNGCGRGDTSICLTALPP